MTQICVSKLTIIDSDNGLSPGRRQTIIWTNVGIWLIGPLGTNFSEILIEIYTFSFTKMHLKMSSEKRRPSCLGLNVLKYNHIMWVLLNQSYIHNNAVMWWNLQNTNIASLWDSQSHLRNKTVYITPVDVISGMVLWGNRTLHESIWRNWQYIGSLGENELIEDFMKIHEETIHW